MIWRLRPQEYDLFDWLDPFGFLERVALPDHFALAATVKDESGEGDSPAGLLVAAVAAEHIIIEWICVAPEYRGQGIGDELILKIMEMAKKDCQREVAALFLETPELLPYLQETEDYFIWQGFLTKREAFGEWDIDLDTYLSHPLFRPSRTRPPRAKPLCEMGEGTLKTIIAALSEKRRRAGFTTSEGFGLNMTKA